jgi:hypothetical protein
VAALTKDTPFTENIGTELDIEVAASTIIYDGAICAFDSSGNIIAYASGVANDFAGHAAEGVDNSSGSAGDVRVAVRRGKYNLKVTLASVALTDAGSRTPVYASDSGLLTMTDPGVGDLPIGRVVQYLGTNSAIVEFDTGIRTGESADFASGLANQVADPGDAGAVPVTASASVSFVSAGAETRTGAVPTFVGQQLSLGFKTDGGDCVVTFASAINQAANTIGTFADAGDHLLVAAIENGGALAWRIVANDGVALS